MAYEVTTPLCLKAAAVVDEALDGLRTGKLETRDVKEFLRGAQTYNGTVNTDVKARVMLPKILVAEAKAAKALADNPTA